MHIIRGEICRTNSSGILLLNSCIKKIYIFLLLYVIVFKICDDFYTFMLLRRKLSRYLHNNYSLILDAARARDAPNIMHRVNSRRRPTAAGLQSVKDSTRHRYTYCYVLRIFCQSSTELVSGIRQGGEHVPACSLGFSK